MSDSGVVAIVLIAVVAVIALVFFTPQIQIDDNNMLSPTGNFADKYIFQSTSISKLMHQMIDPVAPAFISTAQANCGLNSGTWVDSREKMGCYNMAVGSFDASNCITNPVYVQIGNVCNGLDAKWTCDMTNIGCQN